MYFECLGGPDNCMGHSISISVENPWAFIDTLCHFCIRQEILIFVKIRDATQNPGKSAIFGSLKIAIPPPSPLHL